jgi:hypothetical protein
MIGWQSLSYVWRSLRRAPVFTATVVLTLTIGVGSAAAIFAVVNAVLLRPLPYRQPDRLVGIWHDMPSISLNHAQQTAGTHFTYKRYAQTVEGVALYEIFGERHRPRRTRRPRAYDGRVGFVESHSAARRIADRWSDVQ